MTMEGTQAVTPEALFERSVATLVESWAYLASGSPGAALVRRDDAAIAAFVRAPDAEFLNNAVLERWPADFEATVGAIETVYAAHGVERYAVWVHESDADTTAGLRARGYSHAESTRTMAMELDALPAFDLSGFDLGEADLSTFWGIDGLDGLVPELDPARGHFYVARLDGTEVAMLMALDHDRDCGIYIVGTLAEARRRGIASALSAHAIEAARDRGCRTASLQSTPMAEGVYGSVGFRDLGRWLEYVPPA
jgi:GNAT superfamily N-acetyltransferase